MQLFTHLIPCVLLQSCLVLHELVCQLGLDIVISDTANNIATTSSQQHRVEPANPSGSITEHSATTEPCSSSISLSLPGSCAILSSAPAAGMISPSGPLVPWPAAVLLDALYDASDAVRSVALPALSMLLQTLWEHGQQQLARHMLQQVLSCCAADSMLSHSSTADATVSDQKAAPHKPQHAGVQHQQQAKTVTVEETCQSSCSVIPGSTNTPSGHHDRLSLAANGDDQLLKFEHHMQNLLAWVAKDAKTLLQRT